MQLILIPGFWLDASSWEPIVGPVEAAGHTAHPLTLPGLRPDDPDPASVTLQDQVDAVVAVIDSLSAEGGIVLIGHSGGGAVAHAAADARPDVVRRVIYVDSAPLGAGDCINDELPAVDGMIRLPDWSAFESEDLVDLDDQLRASFRARAIPTPLRVATDPQELHDERRYDVPVTVICCEFTADAIRGWMAADVPFCAELKKVKDKALVDLPTGHWPQFTRPDDLAALLVDLLASEA